MGGGGAFPGTRNQHLGGPLFDFPQDRGHKQAVCEGYLSKESDGVQPGMTCPPESPDLSRRSRRRWSAEQRQIMCLQAFQVTISGSSSRDGPECKKL